MPKQLAGMIWYDAGGEPVRGGLTAQLMGDAHATLARGEARELLELWAVAAEATPRTLLVRGEELVDLQHGTCSYYKYNFGIGYLLYGMSNQH